MNCLPFQKYFFHKPEYFLNITDFEKYIIGKNPKKIKHNKYIVRVVKENDIDLAVHFDLRRNRVNVHVNNGIITKVDYWG